MIWLRLKNCWRCRLTRPMFGKFLNSFFVDLRLTLFLFFSSCYRCLFPNMREFFHVNLRYRASTLMFLKKNAERVTALLVPKTGLLEKHQSLWRVLRLRRKGFQIVGVPSPTMPESKQATSHCKKLKRQIRNCSLEVKP